MHLFLTFEYILESYSVSRMIVFLCGAEGAGASCSISLQPLSSVFLVSVPSWPQRALLLELMETASPGELGGARFSKLTLHTFTFRSTL